MNYLWRKKYGFTLVEILIFIVIIVTISLIFTTKVMGSYRRTNDLARKQHIRTLLNAIVLHGYTDFSVYSGAKCSDELHMLLREHVVNIGDIEDPVGDAYGVDECLGGYKFIPYSDADGGILIAQVETRPSANFLYSGGAHDVTTTTATSSICADESCGEEPWRYAQFIRAKE